MWSQVKLMEIFIKLEDEDFAKLVAGRSIAKVDVRGETIIHLMLTDIGWDRMTGHILDAMKSGEDASLL